VHHGAAVVSGVSSNTEYGFLMSRVSGGRPIYWAIGELGSAYVSDSTDAAVNPAPYLNQGPIYYQNIAELHNALHKLRKHNSMHLFSWTWRGSSNPARTSASYGALIGGSVPPIASTLGWSTDLTNHGTLLRGVPIVFYGRARTSSGTTNDLRLVDQSGTQLAILSGFTTGTAQWKTTTATISESVTRLHCQYRSDGAATFDVFAAGAYEYAT
jgi:hypothetical protein